MLPKREDLGRLIELSVSTADVSGVPDVTVVTVVFNAVQGGRRDDLIRCLSSVQSQSGVVLEHVVVDGGSADGTLGVIRDFRPSSHPIRLFSGRDGGIYEAMNRGIALACGRYVVFLNSDDYFCSPCGMQASVRALEAAGADYSYAAANVVNRETMPIRHAYSVADEAENLLRRMTICHQTIVVSRNALCSLDGFDLTYRSASDYDLFLRLIYSGYKGVRVPEKFVTFSSGGFSYDNAELSEKEVDACYRTLFKKFFGMDFPLGLVHKMRATGEYPKRLFELMVSKGDVSFQRKIKDLGYDKWVRDVRQRLDHDLGRMLWAQYEIKALPGGFLKKVLHFSQFACAHPRHAFCAVRAKVLRELSEGGALNERCVTRCEEIARVFPGVYPDDVLGMHDGWRRSERGLICETGIRMPVRARCPVGGGGGLVLSLGLASYEEEDQVVQVQVDDELVGSILVVASNSMTSYVLRLPRNAEVREGSTIALVPKAECDFVFGGVRVCSGRKWKKCQLEGFSWIGAW